MPLPQSAAESYLPVPNFGRLKAEDPALSSKYADVSNLHMIGLDHKACLLPSVGGNTAGQGSCMPGASCKPHEPSPHRAAHRQLRAPHWPPSATLLPACAAVCARGGMLSELWTAAQPLHTLVLRICTQAQSSRLDCADT